MSTKGPGSTPSPYHKCGAEPSTGRLEGAHDDHETHRLETAVYQLANSTVFVDRWPTRGEYLGRVEHERRGTEYLRLAPATLDAVEEVATA